MLGALLRNRCRPIALDVGAHTIKMLQMRRAGSLYRVVASARWRFPEGLTDPQQRDEAAVQAVKEMLRKHPFRGREVSTALSSSELQVKNVRLPQSSPEERQKAISQEAGERFNFPIRPDRIRHITAGTIRQGTEVRDEVILMAVPEDTMARHLTRLAAMGLRPLHIDPMPVALFRGFERFLKRASDVDAVTVLVDIGQTGTRVVVARGRAIVFIKFLDIGGQKLTQAVAKQLGISEQEAGELRLRIMRDGPQDSGDPSQRGSVSWTIYDALRGEVEALAKEIGLCLRYCSVTFRGLRPGSVTLTGGEAYDPAVQKLLGEYLGIQCVVGQPLKGLDVSEVDLGTDRRATLAEWAICAGLAARVFQGMESKETADGHP